MFVDNDQDAASDFGAGVSRGRPRPRPAALELHGVPCSSRAGPTLPTTFSPRVRSIGISVRLGVGISSTGVLRRQWDITASLLSGCSFLAFYFLFLITCVFCLSRRGGMLAWTGIGATL